MRRENNELDVMNGIVWCVKELLCWTSVVTNYNG